MLQNGPASETSAAWPSLPYDAWRDTCSTLHLWTQIIGKVRLAQTPWVNHSWHVALYVTARGLTTSPIPFGTLYVDVTFDFIDHTLRIETSDGRSRHIALRPQSVADFLAAVKSEFSALGLSVSINEYPCEIPNAISLAEDHTHSSYDAAYAERFWRVLLQTDRVFKKFRSGFVGKVSPVHFFWGSFDLAVTRFSGRAAPSFSAKVPGVSSEVMREAYSHEVSSAGFWPGGNGIDYPAFYSYLYPPSDAFKTFSVQPSQAFFSDTLGEFLLPYDAVRTADSPDDALLSFLQTTYEAAATTLEWDRASLECSPGTPGVPRRA